MNYEAVKGLTNTNFRHIFQVFCQIMWETFQPITADGIILFFGETLFTYDPTHQKTNLNRFDGYTSDSASESIYVM